VRNIVVILCCKDKNLVETLIKEAEKEGFKVNAFFEMKTIEEFQRLWDSVLQGEIKVIIFRSLSEIPVLPEKFLRFLLDCIERDILIISLEEKWFNEAIKESCKRSLIKNFSELLLELRRRKISEKVKQVILQLKRKGIKIGRPRKEIPVDEILKYIRKGYSINEIAKIYSVSRATIYRRLKELGIKRRKRKKRKR